MRKLYFILLEIDDEGLLISQLEKTLVNGLPAYKKIIIGFCNH